MTVKSYKDLAVWQQSVELYMLVSEIANDLPYSQRALSDQMLRSSGSIPANIAEGHGRVSTKEYIKFLFYAKGSLNELQTQVELYKTGSFGHETELRKIKNLLPAVSIKLNKLIEVLQAKVIKAAK